MYMKKRIVIFILITLIILTTIKSLYVKPQKVLLVGRLMGFEIDNQNSDLRSEDTIATSSKKIGTVTFVKETTNEFVALGHSTSKDINKKTEVIGTCYDIEFAGISKGSKQETGNVIACLNNQRQIGEIHYDSEYGIFGKINNMGYKCQEVTTQNWYNVKKGKANILIALDEDEPKSYEVEIIGINYLHKNRNIKIKVIDKKLIEKTGGIVQGMSGAPLMQNGKIIGAVNYVTSKDPETAYAVFVDKLL